MALRKLSSNSIKSEEKRESKSPFLYLPIKDMSCVENFSNNAERISRMIKFLVRPI